MGFTRIMSLSVGPYSVKPEPMADCFTNHKTSGGFFYLLKFSLVYYLMGIREIKHNRHFKKHNEYSCECKDHR
jgi:hypothetical protein